MSPDNAPSARPKVLFLSFNYPSSSGTGSQIRSASLVHLLSETVDLHLLIAGYTENLSGPPDPVTDRACRKISRLRIPPSAETGGKWPASNTAAKIIQLPTTDCRQADAADWIVRYYREFQLDRLFVFRFDALHFVYPRLDCFPRRELDLDELPSRRQVQLDRLEGNSRAQAFGESQKDVRVRATMRVLEKSLIPRFDRVFVASAVEADEVRRHTGFQHPLVLPNIYPARETLGAKPNTARTEILFVGSFFYPPNVDAVLYFCREILPRIQEKKGDSVLFRIIGAGNSNALEEVRNQRGVELLGFQENLAPFYAQAALVVVPLRAGVGTRLKILEAFVHERAVVSTSIGAEGLEVTHRQNILLADQPDTFAQACIDLIDQPELAEEISQQAANLHRELYSEEALRRCYAKILAAEQAGS